MGPFLGRFDYSIDAKGRVNIPAKFRKGLNPDSEDTFILCRAPNGCLRAYPKDLWKKREDELSALAETPDGLKLKRQIYSTLSESTLDAQGRVTLTPVQMSLAGIQKDVTLIGESYFVEIWDTGKLTAYLGESESDGFDDAHFKIVDAGMVKQ
ncbi:MAG TPA: division/cell wall cluster transcriptional repressor MraZ [Chitinispirillaceae bacterium]|nr:division/cell wall cluster transcriptional repressor MraZ [Chitinispirillaceae bacterium]